MSDTKHIRAAGVDPIVSFRQMKDGTRADYLLLQKLEQPYVAALPERILGMLARLEHGYGGYAVSRLEHSLQAATRAHADGADEELVVAALVHDIGDDLAPCNHAALAAEILRPYVRAEVTWIVEQHGVFQMYYYAHHLGGDRNARQRFKSHPWYHACASFCARWDQSSFDPDYPSQPLSFFEPMVRRIFTRPAHDPAHTGMPAE